MPASSRNVLRNLASVCVVGHCWCYGYWTRRLAAWPRALKLVPPDSCTACAQVFGVFGDLGDTANSSTVRDHLLAANPDFILNTGDFTYAGKSQGCLVCSLKLIAIWCVCSS